ncbi:MAG: phospho-sugar mutase [Verrucomicrobiota bacterium]
MSDLDKKLKDAVDAGKLMGSSAGNIKLYFQQPGCEQWEKDSMAELLGKEQWRELNDRFFKTLAFGTGGIRGRTIGREVTSVERGTSMELDCPQYPAVGTNVMNFFNIGRATQGLCSYLSKKFTDVTPKLVISHDTRFFSRQFAELTAKTASEMGLSAYLFEADRSTPELSFAVRFLEAHAGVMITASHNPSHDNGYKVYFQDGAQIVEPHASGIIKEVLEVKSGRVQNMARKLGVIHSISQEVDKAYANGVGSLVLDADLIKQQAGSLKIVFTPIHGTGMRTIPDVLGKFDFRFSVVPEQEKGDGRFPTVKSPNPENAEALTLGIEQAKREQADLLMATDPDADRMGVAVRNSIGEYEVITGNMIGTIMAAYRLEKLFEQSILNSANAKNAALIKTFVTTDLQKVLAESYGVKCVETLTGFKYIGEKLGGYEEQAGGRGDASDIEWRSKLLEKSTYFVFGGEESYGYSGGDYVRDKDANAAVLMFAEAAAYTKAKGITVLEYLDQIYLKFGFYFEKLGTLTFEGAEGAAKIQKLLQSYKDEVPEHFNNLKVEKVQNFKEEDYQDIDGKAIPKELMLIFHLSGGARIAVRASGTEPKIKFYFFNKATVSNQTDLPSVKTTVKEGLESLWLFTQEDVQKRIA